MILRREIFQIGEKELIAADWRLKEKGYLTRVRLSATGNWTPLLYTYGVNDGRRSAGFSLLPLSVHPQRPLVANRWISRRGVSTEQFMNSNFRSLIRLAQVL